METLNNVKNNSPTWQEKEVIILQWQKNWLSQPIQYEIMEENFNWLSPKSQLT